MKQHIRSYLIFCILLIVCLVCISCSNDPEEDALNKQNNIKETISNEQIKEEVKEEYIEEDKLQLETASTSEDVSEPRVEISNDFLKNFYDFTERTSAHLFQENISENQIYAPFNSYLALSMLCEMVEEEARREIEEVLGISDVEPNRSEVIITINTLEKSRTNLGRLNINSSLWLNDQLSYQEPMLDIFHNQYGTEIYKGDLKELEFQNSMSKWVSDNTNNEFQPSYHNMTNNVDPFAFISLNTLNFYNEWLYPFEEEDTRVESFILRDRNELNCDFMNMERSFHPFMVGEDYVSTICLLKENESMLFILPDQGLLIEDFLEQRGKLSGIISDWTSEEFSFGKVRLSVPKFSYDGDVDLMETAKAMGIKKIFDKESKAFSVFSDESLYISDIKQASKISIDEKGCSASSYTEIIAMGSGVSKDEIEINLNRPFIYVLYKDKVPFLVGLVQNPLG